MSRYPFAPLIDLSDPEVIRERVKACGQARAGYWFWLPCPLCGLEFGGHESMRGTPERPAEIHVEGDPPNTARGICPYCTMAGRGADPRFRWDWAYREAEKLIGEIEAAQDKRAEDGP